MIETAKDLGIQGEIWSRSRPSPSAPSRSPRSRWRRSTATLANGGTRPALHGLAAVRDRFGEPILGDDLQAPRRVLPPQAAWLVTSILQGAMDRGTGAGVRRFGIRDRLAGKTGTTNDRRDSWFAGYSPDRVTVVWVGYDDNAETRLSGSRAALPIWSRFVAAVRPAAGLRPLRAAAGDRAGHGRSADRPARHPVLPLPGDRAVRRVAGAERALPPPRARWPATPGRTST